MQPHLYGENGDEPDADPGRDALSLALIRQASDRRIPLFAICRGMQEMVVATQGTLHRRLYELPELQEHQKITTCRWNSNTPPPTKSSFRKEGCFHN